METLKLESTFRARLLDNGPSTMGMLRAAKNLVAWGQVNPEVMEAFRSGEGSSLRTSGTVHQDLLYFARKVETREGEVYFVRRRGVAPRQGAAAREAEEHRDQ